MADSNPRNGGGLPVILVHRSSSVDRITDIEPLLSETDINIHTLDLSDDEGPGSPMPPSSASSGSPQRTPSISSTESLDGSAPANNRLGDAQEAQTGVCILIPRQELLGWNNEPVQGASSLPTSGRQEMAVSKTRRSSDKPGIPILKSILKRRNSDPTACPRKTGTTFHADVHSGRGGEEVERPSRALPVEGSDDENRKVSYSLPDGYREGRTSDWGFLYREYGTRYYVLFIFCAFGFIYGVLWNSLGPVAKTAEIIFCFNDADIALVANMGPIGFTLTLVGYTFIIQRKGLRWACVISSSLMFLGAGLHCLVTWQKTYARLFVHAGYFCIGMARFVAQVSPPVLSATWFKAEQRTTATAIAVLMPQLGMSLFAVVEPFIVEELRANITVAETPHCLLNDSHPAVSPSQQEKIDRIFSQIMEYMFIQLFMAGGICIAMWIYFPARPPSPPTKSASVMKMTLRRGFRMAYRNRNLWVVAIPGNAVCGVLVGWISLLELNLKQVQIKQSTCGWLIFGNTFGGVLAGVIIARVSDRKVKRMKPLLMTLLVCGFISILLFSLQVYRIIPSTLGTIYASCVLVGISLYAALPLICEISAELAYPVQEHVALVINIIVMNVFTFLYLLPPLFPHVGVVWMNWTFLIVVAVALPIIACYRQKYMRAEHDKYLTAEGIGSHKVDEWLRNDQNEDEPLARDMNWVDDTEQRSRSRSSTMGSIQDGFESPSRSRPNSEETTPETKRRRIDLYIPRVDREIVSPSPQRQRRSDGRQDRIRDNVIV